MNLSRKAILNSPIPWPSREQFKRLNLEVSRAARLTRGTGRGKPATGLTRETGRFARTVSPRFVSRAPAMDGEEHRIDCHHCLLFLPTIVFVPIAWVLNALIR